jgi:hypothetical protein
MGRSPMGKSLFCVLSAALWVVPVGNGLGQTKNPAALGEDKPVGLDADPHLVGWWKLDDVSGKTAADACPRGHQGTLEGGLSFDESSVPGRVGKALKLDGKAGFVQVTGYKGVTGTRPRTVAAWIKTTTPRGEIMSWGKDDFGKMLIFGFIRGGIGVTPSGGYLYINARVHDDAWHHVAIVVEEAELPNLHDDVRLYKDGVLQEVHDIGLLDLWPIDTGGELDLRIGRRFNGLLDDVRLYDRALSEEEIKALSKLQGKPK